jgi:uncharacterized membrane protein YbhN (UPF0104 family)
VSAPRLFTAKRLRHLELAVVTAVLLFAAGGAAAALLVGGGEVLAALSRVDVSTATLLVLLALVNHGCRTLRWYRFSRQIGIRIPFGRTLVYYIAGFAMAATPARAGEALRLWLLEKCHGYGYGRAMPLMVADRVFDVIALLLLALLGAAAFPEQRWLILLGLTFVLALAVALARPAWILAVIGWSFAAVRGRAPRFFGWLRRTVRGTARLFGGAAMPEGLALSLIGWSAECAALALLLERMGAPIGFAPAAFVFAFSASIGGLTLIPGGLGGTEVAMVGLLTVLGVDPTTSVAATIVIRAATLWFGVAIGFLALGPAMRLARSGRAAGGAQA